MEAPGLWLSLVVGPLNPLGTFLGSLPSQHGQEQGPGSPLAPPLLSFRVGGRGPHEICQHTHPLPPLYYPTPSFHSRGEGCF